MRDWSEAERNAAAERIAYRIQPNYELEAIGRLETKLLCGDRVVASHLAIDIQCALTAAERELQEARELLQGVIDESNCDDEECDQCAPIRTWLERNRKG